jgi:outer membrane protein TolC
MALNHKVENHMLRVFYQVLALLALSGNIIWGQGADSILSLSQALQTGLQNNLILQQDRQRIQQGQARLQMQKSGYFPRVSANGLYNHVTDFPEVALPLGSAIGGAGDVNIYDFSVKLQQPLFTGFRVKNLVRSAGAELEYNESQYRSNLHLLVYQITNTYRAAQLNQLQQQVLQSSMQRVKNDLQTTRNLYRAGQCSAFDTLTIANQYLNIQTDLNEMIHQYQNILTRLEFLLNITSVQGVDTFSASTIGKLSAKGSGKPSGIETDKAPGQLTDFLQKKH